VCASVDVSRRSICKVRSRSLFRLPSSDGPAARPVAVTGRGASPLSRTAKNKQIALAIVGGLAAGAAAYNASHQTTNYSSWGYVGNRPVLISGTIQTYDPAAGMFAGLAVGAATGVGIHQIAQAAGNREQAAQGIFQRTTIAPGATAVGQVQIKAGRSSLSNVRLTVPVSGQPVSASFDRKVTQ
jgi:hypothetical protein